MGIRINRGYLAIGFAAVFLVGCASDKSDTDTMEDGPGDETQTMTDNTDNIDSMAQPEVVMPAAPEIRNGDIWVPETPDSQNLMALSGVFYFDFDQAIVKRAGHSELNKHASVLASDGALRLRLQGHADERGTREYNLALGERRANAVRAYLVAQGASRTQVEVISYGEEKPADAGHSERAWAMNRRVEFSYR
ncbi:peptidoglycan-associated lipoprotein Pal [Pseudomonadales bacterium]|nr:peptidoglycan-associated lipoprotein Pal [Pseudomonadales bacterium]